MGKGFTDRADDERVLLILQLRDAGYNSITLGERFGCHPAYVRATTNRVRDADIKECGTWGDVPKEVERWWKR